MCSGYINAVSDISFAALTPQSAKPPLLCAIGSQYSPKRHMAVRIVLQSKGEVRPVRL